MEQLTINRRGENMKAVTYQGIKDVKVKEVPDAKIEKKTTY